MNNLTQLVSSETKTMTLKEITDLLGVRHNDAMNIVERMAKETEFGTITKISYTLAMPNNASKQMETYQLDKRQSIAVASRLNTTMLMRIVDRWQELESNQLRPLTQLEAYKQLVVMEEQRIAMITHIAQQEGIIKEDAILTEKSETHYTVKQLRSMGIKASGKALSRVCERLGLEIKSVFSQYAGMDSNTYPAEAINLLYGTSL